VWVILHYDRQCRVCGEKPPLLRRAWFSILDELRRLGLYDRNHAKLGDGFERGTGHQEDPPVRYDGYDGP
jgi:hypothetical protein